MLIDDKDESEGLEELSKIDLDGTALKGLDLSVTGAVGNIGLQILKIEDSELSISCLVAKPEDPVQFFGSPLAIHVFLDINEGTLVSTFPTQESPLGWTCLSK